MTRDEIAAFVFNEIDDIIYVVDAVTDNVLFMNEKGKKLVGAERFDFDKEQVPYYKLLYKSEQPPADSALEKAKREGYYTTEIYNPEYDKYHFCKYKMVQIGGRELIVGVLTDITKVYRVTQEIERRLKTEETLIACIHTLNDNRDVETAIHELLRIIADYHKAERAYIFERKERRDYFDNTYEWCAPGIVPRKEIFQETSIPVMEHMVNRLQESGEFFITSLKHEIDNNSVEYRLLHRQGIDGLMAAPLEMEGDIIGFLGVGNPHENTDTLVLMRSVAAFIVNDFQKRKTMDDLYEQSIHDRLTGVGNRRSCLECISAMEGREESLGIIFADINGLKKANDRYGHEYGDNMIREMADILKYHFKDYIYRIGGDEFVVFVPGVSEEEFHERTARLKGSWTDKVNAAVGGVWLAQCVGIERQVAGADKLMYLDKQAYYKRGVISGE